MASPEEDLERRAHARLGTMLNGKYRLDKVLGIGGMAVVYAATHRNGKEFAVKMLHPELSLHSDVRTRILREGYVANKVKHPGAVTVIDDDIAEDGSAFLVMELLEGQTAEELWEEQGQRIPLQHVLSMGHTLLSVIAAAHANGIIHRDIKPANLFLTNEGQLKVLDFGIARLRDVATSHATQTGMMMGTPAFMAPEQAMAKTKEIDGQTDVWSAGATLYTLVSGNLIHEGENAQQILVIAATRPAASLATVMPEAHPEVVKVIDRALAFEKRDRWSSAAEMRDALAQVYTLLYGGPPASLVATKPPSPAAIVHTAPMESRPGLSTPRPSAPASVAGSTQLLAPTPVAQLLADERHRSITTTKPVARDGTMRAAAVRQRWIVRFVAAAGGAALIAAVVLLVVARGGSNEPRAIAPSGPAATTNAPSAAAPQPVSTPATTLAPLDNGLPAPSNVSIDPLPTVAAAAPKAASARAATPATKPMTPAATKATLTGPPRAGCNPPYVVDTETGTKKWKVECL
jgi:serine/threonine-protein kinase